METCIYRKWSERIYTEMTIVGSRIREEMGGEGELFAFILYFNIVHIFIRIFQFCNYTEKINNNT